MTTHDPALDHLRDLATQTWDADAARTLMAHLTPDPSQVLTREYLDLRLTAELGGVRTELRTEMADLRTEMADLRSDLRTEMADLRTDVRTEMHAAITSQTRWLIGSMLAFGALVSAVG